MLILSEEERNEIEIKITACEAQLENEMYEEGEDEKPILSRKAVLTAMLDGNMIYETNARCPKCGAKIYTSGIPEYPFLCPVCDENFGGYEIEENCPTQFEIHIPIDGNFYRINQQKLADIVSKAGASFVVYDDICLSMDIGFPVNVIPDTKTLSHMLLDIENIQYGIKTVKKTIGAVSHDEYGDVYSVCMATFEVPDDPKFSLRDALYKTARDYCNSDSGREYYNSIHGLYNFGDLIEAPDSFFAHNGIRLVSVVSQDDLWNLDEIMVRKDDIKTENEE